jgi:hypothetical protein
MRDFLTTQLLEPNLLVPGLVPTGEVEQDLDHPLAVGLVSRVPLTSGAGRTAFNLIREKTIF